MKKRTVSAGTALKKALTSAGLGDLFVFGVIEAEWEEIVGAGLSRNCWPESFAQGELRVAASEPVWVDTLTYMTREIAARTNAFLKSDAVKVVKIVRATTTLSRPQNKEKEPPPPPTAEEVAEAEKALWSVEDPELRSIFKRVMLKSLQAREPKETKTTGRRRPR